MLDEEYVGQAGGVGEIFDCGAYRIKLQPVATPAGLVGLSVQMSVTLLVHVPPEQVGAVATIVVVGASRSFVQSEETCFEEKSTAVRKTKKPTRKKAENRRSFILLLLRYCEKNVKCR